MKAKSHKNQTKLIAIILAILLAGLICWIIYGQLKEHYAQDDPTLLRLKKVFEDFFAQDRKWEPPLDMLNNRDIMKEISLYRGNKSYTINKEKVYICLKDKEGRYFNDNLLIYVISHELGHTLTDEVGHTQKFHTIFEALLVELTKAGIYNPSLPIDSDYCSGSGDPEV